MSPITTHVLDTARGKPAEGIEVILESEQKGKWSSVAKKKTNKDGRVPDLMDGKLSKGQYRLTFLTGDWFKKTGASTFYPKVEIHFEITNPDEHYHVPLLLSAFGYSTYRGS